MGDLFFGEIVLVVVYVFDGYDGFVLCVCRVYGGCGGGVVDVVVYFVYEYIFGVDDYFYCGGIVGVWWVFYF